MTDVRPGSLGKRLRQERELRHWTQEQLAEHIGRSVPSINRWEHDRAEPQPDALKQLAALFGKPPDRWGTSRWNVPFLRNPYFTGREQLLLRLHRTLAVEKTVALSQTRVISGLGGIGKTQTALEYAYRYAREYEAVLWVQADSHELLVSDFARLAQTLDLPGKEEKDQWRIVSAVKHWLQEHSAWLLILDNADNLAVIADFLPRGMGGATLVTTRSQATGKIARSLAVDKMEVSEGIRFVLRRATLLEEDEPLETVSAATRTAAQQLVEELDGLPLALDQAGAYLEETGCSLSEYLALYARHRLALLKRESSVVSEYPHTVASTWSLSFSQVEQADPAAADLLRVCAFLHPDTIPEEILTTGAAALGAQLQEVAAEPLLLNGAIQLLRRYSLVKRDAEAKLLNMHRLVQVVLKETLDAPMQRQWAERAMLAVNTAFPSVEYSTWPQCERLLSQALTAAQIIEQYQIVSAEAGRLLHETASYLQERGRYAEAEPLYQRARQIREQYLGSEHPDVATSLCKMADLYRVQNKYTEAESLYQQTLRIREQHPDLGPEHPDVATSLAGLANLYRDIQRFTEAEQLYKRSRAIFEQYLGPEYPRAGQVLSSQGISYARVLNSLGALNKDQGRFTEAEQLYKRARAIFEQHLGLRHYLVAFPVCNLAILYKDQHRLDEAEPLYQLAPAIYEEQLGAEHPDVAVSCNNLAEFYKDLGRYDEAEPLYQRALHIWEKQFSSEHYLVAIVFNNLADIYHEQGRYTEAESFYQHALDIFERHLGREHYFNAYSLHGLANLYCKQGEYTKAEPLYQRALAIRERTWGPQHHETAESVYDLAQLREAQGNLEEAKTWYASALAVREQALGVHHPRTTETRTRLIALLHVLGQHEDAAHLEAAQSEQRTDEEERKTHLVE